MRTICTVAALTVAVFYLAVQPKAIQRLQQEQQEYLAARREGFAKRPVVALEKPLTWEERLKDMALAYAKIGWVMGRLESTSAEMEAMIARLHDSTNGAELIEWVDRRLP